MVALRSTRQDRTLLIAVWALTVLVLVLGGLTTSPILLVWGTVGLAAAIFLTRIHIRDTRGRGSGGGTPPGAGADEAPGSQDPDATHEETADAEESR